LEQIPLHRAGRSKQSLALGSAFRVQFIGVGCHVPGVRQMVERTAFAGARIEQFAAVFGWGKQGRDSSQVFIREGVVTRLLN
jgi:hypothetical protein